RRRLLGAGHQGVRVQGQLIGGVRLLLPLPISRTNSMSETLCTYRLEGAVAFVGLNRPEKRNAINEPLVAALSEAVLRAHDEADVGVLHAHGPNFSAGLDLNEALARATSTAPPRKRRRHSWHEVFDQIARGPIPWLSAL